MNKTEHKKEHFVITTLKQAKRLVKTVIGFTVLLIGLAMIVLPGPAIVVIPVGLAILATEFVWARKLYKRFESGATNLKNSIFNNSKKP
ncbi:MAG: PGPGW domain-containing protein [Thermodesulfovibrionia bacterium]|nr:PGPGW domain-containing protein [Thermodesulfovibrionia bacterium]